MEFGRPIAALLFLLLPALVLLNARGGRRDARVVPSLALWADVPLDSRGSETRLRVPAHWSFALQALALVAATLALMAPATTGDDVAAGAIVVVIDVSASMAATDVAPSRLNAAKAAARAIVGGAPRGARTALVVAGARPELVLPFTSDAAAVAAAVEATAVTDAAADIEAAVRLARSLVGDARAAVHVFTDGPVRGAGLPISVHTFADGADNVSVRGLAVSRTGSGGYVARARVVNHGRRLARVPLVLTPAGRAPAARTVRVAPNETADVEFLGEETWGEDASFRLELRHTDGLSRDDHAYAVLPARRRLQALIVGERTRPLAALMALDPTVAVTTALPREYLRTDSPRLTVFRGWTPPTLPRGDVVLLDPSPDTPYAPARRVTTPAFVDVRATHPAFRLVDLVDVAPRLLGVYAPASDREPLMQTDAGPAAVAWEDADRRVLVIGFDPFDLRASDMSLRPATVILFVNVVEWARERSRVAPTEVEAGHVVTLPGAAVDYALEPAGDLHRDTLSVSRAGIYALTAPSRPVELIAANPSGGESDLWGDVATPAAPALAPSGPVARPLWAWFTLAAVLCLAAEWAIYHRSPATT